MPYAQALTTIIVNIDQISRKQRTRVISPAQQLDPVKSMLGILVYNVSSDLLCLDEWRWWSAETVPVSVEVDSLCDTGSILSGLNPLAQARASPQALEESDTAAFCVALVVLTHDWLDGLSSLISMVEWNG